VCEKNEDKRENVLQQIKEKRKKNMEMGAAKT